MTDRWLPVNEARRDLSRLVREAALGKSRFIFYRGEHQQYQAALIPYDNLQRPTAREAVKVVEPTVSPPQTALYAEYLHTAGGQDRIAAEHVHGVWPLIIVADGIGGAPGGAEAADAAVTAVCEYLREQLPKLSTCEQVLSALRQTYYQVAARMREQELAGATTLLIGLLWSSPEASFWCYSYEGDGFLTLLSPSRPVNGITVPERLLAPQKVGGTACLDRDGLTVPPVVGLRLWEPGDLLYLATDGIISLFSWVFEEHRETLDHFLRTRVGRSPGWADLLRAFPNYVDDAVMGVIRTGDS